MAASSPASFSSDVVELVRVEQLVGGAHGDPEQRAIRPAHQPVDVHALRLDSQHRQHAAIHLSQHLPIRPGAHIERFAAPTAVPGRDQRVGEGGQGGRIGQRDPVRRPRDARKPLQNRGNLRAHPADWGRFRAEAKAQPVARQHGVGAGGDVAHERVHRQGVAEPLRHLKHDSPATLLFGSIARHMPTMKFPVPCDA